MLARKIYNVIEQHFVNKEQEIILVDGSRQVGKTYIIRKVGESSFKNFVEINMVNDSEGERLFAVVNDINDLYLKLSLVAGNKLDSYENTLIFFDEIQVYPHLITLLKFLCDDKKYNFIASGSQLGITLRSSKSIPMGRIKTIRMYPLDFEEFLWANGVDKDIIEKMELSFNERKSLEESIHQKIMSLFRLYLIVGGLPAAINEFLKSRNVHKIREIQKEIHTYYAYDSSKYDEDCRLRTRRIYDLIPSNMENKKKRVVIKDITEKKGKTVSDYQEEFEYLISSGIALSVNAITNPSYPLISSGTKNLLKLYMNDVGILTAILFGDNSRPILDDVKSINLGAVYETVVACELAAHDHLLYYYDNKSKGEVDYLVDDNKTMSVVPIEVKSGRDYTIHSALSNFTSNEEYNIDHAYVLYSGREIKQKNKIIYLPIYFVMFIKKNNFSEEELLL